MKTILIIVIAAIAVFYTYNTNAATRNQKRIIKLLSSEKSIIIVDVRTNEEFNSGHIEKSINIPLSNISNETEKLKKYNIVVTVCVSGVRSKQARSILRKKGLSNVINGGGWVELNRKINNQQ